MGLFRRKSRESAPTPPTAPSGAEQGAPRSADEVTTPARTTDAGPSATSVPPTAEAAARGGDELGPFDRGAIDDDGGYVDLGAIWVPGIQGLMLTMEMDEATGEVTAVRVHLGDSLLQLQAFAAPKSSGLWADIRDELVEGVRGQGGACDVSEGRFGTEVLARIPAGQDRDGRPAEQRMRFVGVDGPRWFLRGVLSGPAATEPEVAAPLLDLFSVLVVDRGDEPMAPRELLPLRLPAEAAPGQEASPEGAPEGASGPASTEELRPFERGPEMTETR